MIIILLARGTVTGGVVFTCTEYSKASEFDRIRSVGTSLVKTDVVFAQHWCVSTKTSRTEIYTVVGSE